MDRRGVRYNPRKEYPENDRFYNFQHNGRYLFPCDEVRLLRAVGSMHQKADRLSFVKEEGNRLDILHKTFTVARGKLFSAPVTISPGYMCNILDLGCGTGIWSIDVAECVYSETPWLRDVADTPYTARPLKESAFAGSTSS